MSDLELAHSKYSVSVCRINKSFQLESSALLFIWSSCLDLPAFSSFCPGLGRGAQQINLSTDAPALIRKSNRSPPRGYPLKSDGSATLHSETLLEKALSKT